MLIVGSEDKTVVLAGGNETILTVVNPNGNGTLTLIVNGKFLWQ